LLYVVETGGKSGKKTIGSTGGKRQKKKGTDMRKDDRKNRKKRRGKKGVLEKKNGCYHCHKTAHCSKKTRKIEHRNKNKWAAKVRELNAKTPHQTGGGWGSCKKNR